MSDYNSTARFLSNPDDRHRTISPMSNRTNSHSPVYTRRSLSAHSQRPKTYTQQVIHQATSLQTRVLQTYSHFTPLQRILIGIAGTVFLVLGILFLIYNERIFGALAPFAQKWRDIPAGWLILWAATFLVSFPPLIGYSSCVTLAGFVFGVWKGWLIVASASVVGSTASFLASRYFLKGFVGRMTANDKRFAALAMVLKHDGVKLLFMIRLCPLPYSLSNGAISTIPTVSPLAFALATAAVSPKLLLHCFVGSRLGAIAENGDKMDAKTKAISYLSIVIGITAGIGTGLFMYSRTKARARELEVEERENAVRAPRDEEEGFRDEGEYQYSDDPAEREAAQALARDRDGISLHTAEAEEDGVYRDDFEDDGEAQGDARSLDDVFRDGDGDDDDDPWNDEPVIKGKR